MEVNNGLSILFINTLAVSGSNIFAVARRSITGGGVFLSTNNGDNWTYVGLTNYEVYSLAISGNNFFAGTNYVTDVEKTSDILPQNFNLSQNYPNPFNPTTNIEYSMPESSFVQLIVYDVLGSEVATLVNEEQSVGVYRVDFNAAALSSGAYFYRMHSGNFIQTRKMLLLK